MGPSSETSRRQHEAAQRWPQEQLIRFREGQRDALTFVYRNYSAEIAKLLREGFYFDAQGITRRFIGYSSPFELQDALHETFRRAFEPRARTAYDGLRPYGPYLRRIAQNLVLKSFRQREIAFPISEASESTDSSKEQALVQPLTSSFESSPEAITYRKQVKSLVQEFLTTLNEPDQKLLRLRFVEGLSQRQVADQLHLGRQIVRSREAKLRSKLLSFLHNRGEPHEGVSTWPLLISLLIEVLP